MPPLGLNFISVDLGNDRLFTLPLIAAHPFILYLRMMSMAPPPRAIGGSFAASIARVASSRDGWTADFIPLVFLFPPVLVEKGPLPAILVDENTVILGSRAISAADIGWTVRRVGRLCGSSSA
ncbi:MAG: hypothetical protein AAF264_01450 [Pseudomonadota bacterium]